jgi:hypothetical protein
MLRVRLPEGWTAIKLGEENMNQFAAYADQLEALMPSQDASAAPGIGGIIGAVTKLVASLRGGDARTIMIGVRDLLNVLIGEGGESISFQQASATIDWSKLVEILGQILPLILKLL